MSKFVLKYETISRLEEITKTKITRGGDKVVNNALDILERKKDERGIDTVE